MLTATLSTLTPRMRLNLLKPKIENLVFKLHYQMTVTILIAFVILVCAREYFGDHIKCISDQGVPDHVIQTYCFFMATFTIVRHYNESLLQSGFLPHPGVGPMMDTDETLNHTYYQWVPFVLFIQSICFYMPHYIWKKKEGGRIKALVTGLQYATIALEEEDMTVNGKTIPSKHTLDSRLETIRKDIILRLKISRTWSTWLVAMEVANLLHVMFQIWVINKFLHGQFISLGSQILSFSDWEQITDPLETIFPKVTKCIFHKYGPSGSIQQHDALCVMALNIIHEKIYTVLWFWLLFLFIASLLAVTRRQSAQNAGSIATLNGNANSLTEIEASIPITCGLYKKFKNNIAVMWRAASFFLYRRSLRFNQLVFRRANDGKFNPYNVIQVVNGCQFADWLFLYYLAKNMQGFVFSALFSKLAEELEKREVAGEDQGTPQKGAEPILISNINYDDETLPLKDDKKSS